MSRMMVHSQSIEQGLSIVMYLLRSNGRNFDDVTDSINYRHRCLQYLFRELLTRKRQGDQGRTEVSKKITSL